MIICTNFCYYDQNKILLKKLVFTTFNVEHEYILKLVPLYWVTTNFITSKCLERTTKSEKLEENHLLQKCPLTHIIAMIIMRLHNALSLPESWRKLSIRYPQNIPPDTHKIYSLTVKPNSWPSCNKTVWNKQEKW